MAFLFEKCRMKNEKLRMKNLFKNILEISRVRGHVLRSSLFILHSSLFIFLVACDREKPIKYVDKQAKTLLMYDNIGEPHFSRDVDEAGKAVAAGALIEGQRVIVYHRMSGGDQIYELVQNGKQFKKVIIKQYDRGEMETLNPVDMRIIIGDMRAATPQARHFGFAFGSHGSGWLPANASLQRSAVPAGYEEIFTVAENPTTRAFASENSVRMDVGVFVNVMDDWDWDFLILDDCFMAGVEPLYQMRDMSDYIIASPTEILIEGFPYDRVVSTLFGKASNWETGLESTLVSTASEYVSFFRDGYGRGPYATIALIKMSEMEDLARSVRLLNTGGLMDGNELNFSRIQHYEGLNTHLFYDVEDYLSQAAVNKALYEEFYAQLKRTVVFKDHTTSFFSAYPGGSGSVIRINSDGYSGLSAFIPWSGTSRLESAYHNTEWYRATNP